MVLHAEIEISVMRTCQAKWAYDFGDDRERNVKREFGRPYEIGSQFERIMVVCRARVPMIGGQFEENMF
jgi:hypothetical protein